MHTHLEALQEKETPAVIHLPGDDINLTALSTNNSGMSNSPTGTRRGEAHRKATIAVHSDKFLIPSPSTL